MLGDPYIDYSTTYYNTQWTYIKPPETLCRHLPVLFLWTLPENSAWKSSEPMSASPWIWAEFGPSADVDWPMSDGWTFVSGGPWMMESMAGHYVRYQCYQQLTEQLHWLGNDGLFNWSTWMLFSMWLHVIETLMKQRNSDFGAKVRSAKWGRHFCCPVESISPRWGIPTTLFPMAPNSPCQTGPYIALVLICGIKYSFLVMCCLRLGEEWLSRDAAHGARTDARDFFLVCPCVYRRSLICDRNSIVA